MILKRLFNISSAAIRRHLSTLCPKEDCMNVTILGACVPTGRTLALLLKQCMDINEIRLFGRRDDVCSAAVDLSHVDTNPRIRAFKGDSALLEQCLTGSNIVVICGGDPTHLTERQQTLFYKNIDPIKYYAIHIAEYCPDAMVLVQTPPVDSFVPLLSEEFKKAAVYNPKKIIGLCNENCIIASTHVAKYLKTNPIHVLCPVIGGTSPSTMVPVLSQATPAIGLTNEDAAEMHAMIVTAKTRILERKFIENHGSIYLLQAFAACRFINNLIRAMKGDKNCIDVAFVRQLGHIRDFHEYMATIVKLGANGVEETFMPRLNQRESQALKTAHRITREAIEMGESFVTGEILKYQKPRQQQPMHFCDTILSSPVDIIGDVVVDLSKRYRNFQIYT